ncbi:hypothetical protein [Methylobacterium sp. Leaf93]|uniref:hypothetical protein n=1 Tax=Methylobacterium sp. Leaf93 TaxID=1736249 RepID=UPI0007145564|nr:hypothetical protein [Methylobacterium sp. Leaf93]KQP16543.1 hypothetical protein ASF26_01530 [Methylobacterium sp. Leaf93]
MKLLRFLGLARDANEPSIRDRAAALRASAARVIRREPLDQAGNDRRVLIAGSLAAAMPLPAIAMVEGPVSTISPDADLLSAGERYLRAKKAEEAAREAWGNAWRQVYPVLQTCPPALLVTRDEKFAVLGGWRWPSRLGVNLRHLPTRPEDSGKPTAADYIGEAWTGQALREAIRQAVTLMGRGGQTPHRIRRWHQMLPIADAFDAQMQGIEAASNYQGLRLARREAEMELHAARLAIHGMVATTPEGLAVLTRLIGSYSWKDSGYGMPDLLRSAANVSGVDLAELEHQYASTHNSARS